MSTNYAVDTALTGSRGSPNAWSPGSDLNDWSQDRGAQTISYTSNKLKMAYNGSLTAGVMTYAGLSKTDQEVIVNVTQNNATNDMGGAVCRFSDSTHWYCAVIGNSAGNFQIIKDVGGTFTTKATTPFATVVGTAYTIKFRVTGTTLQAKVWSGTEPTAWTLTTTDSSLSSGKFGVTGIPQSGHSTSFDTFSANDALIPLSTQNTETSQVRSLVLDQCSGTFKSSAALVDQGRETIKVRGAQSIRSRDTFKSRETHTTQAHEIFKSRAVQVSLSHDMYRSRAAQLDQGRGRFLNRGVQGTKSTSIFKTSTIRALITQARDAFKTRVVQVSPGRGRFQVLSFLNSLVVGDFFGRVSQSTRGISTFLISTLKALITQGRTTLETRSGQRTGVQDVFKGRVPQLTGSRELFKVQAKSAVQGRTRFLIRLPQNSLSRNITKVKSTQGSVGRDVFRPRAENTYEARATFKTRVIQNFTSLDSLARSTFKIRSAQVSKTRGIFKNRAVQATPSRPAFKSRAVQASGSGSRFLTRLGQVLTSRMNFKNRVVQTTRVRPLFKSRAVQNTPNRPRFFGRVGLLSGYRGVFQLRVKQTVTGITTGRTRAVQDTVSRTTFLNAPKIVYVPLRVLFFIIQKINSSFIPVQKTTSVFLVVQRINLTFGGSPMPQPNSTITSTATVKDSTGALLFNLSVVSVTITFPDFTTSIVGLGSGVVNVGSGLYSVTYATKGPGPTREEWRVTAADGTTIADFLNWVAVGY